MKETAAFFETAAASATGAHSGPAISARTSRSCVSRYCPTSSGGGSTHSSGSAGRDFPGVRGGASTTLFARLRFALASASETSHPAYAASSSPATGSWLYRRRMSFRLAPSSTSTCRSRRAIAFSISCHSGGVSSGLPASSHRTYARMSTRSFGISTSAKEDSTRVSRFGALASAAGGGVAAGAAGSFVISIEGANGAEGSTVRSTGGGGGRGGGGGDARGEVRRRRRRRRWRRPR